MFSHRASSVRSDWTHYELSLTNDGWTLARRWWWGGFKNTQKSNKSLTHACTPSMCEKCALGALNWYISKATKTVSNLAAPSSKPARYPSLLQTPPKKKNVKENHPISLKRRQAGGKKKTNPKKNKTKQKNTRAPITCNYHLSLSTWWSDCEAFQTDVWFGSAWTTSSSHLLPPPASSWSRWRTQSFGADRRRREEL